MWKYTDEVMDHYRNPRNVGEIEDATLIGEAGSLACGDKLKLYLKVNESGIIEDAKFQTFGCGSAVASSSILTEMLIGKTLEEAKQITNKDIADKLGGLPPQKMHCSVMGHEALEDALAKHYDEDVDPKEHKKIICQCMHVTEEEIVKAIKEQNLQTTEEVCAQTSAGSACGRCIPIIEKILEDEKNCVTPVDITKMTKTQQILKVYNIIETHIAGELRKDGGDIELVDIDGNKIYVSLKGSCKACKNSQLTLKNFVESSLKEYLNKDIEVIGV